MYFIPLLLLAGTFGAGRVSVLWSEKEPLAIEGYLPEMVVDKVANREVGSSSLNIFPANSSKTNSPAPSASSRAAPATTATTFIASQTGKSYYFPWCGIVKRIKVENQIIFHSQAEAEKAGYKPGNCAGLK